MKLSEAIRLGAMLGPQGFGLSKDREGDGTLCANQAAMVALGLVRIWQHQTAYLPVGCPACECKGMLGAVVANCLNDRHRWTREQIADWIATLEPQEIAAEQPAEETVLVAGQ